MQTDLTLTGQHIRLEPLDPAHTEALVAASAGDPTLYQWSLVPQDRLSVERYIQTAIAWRDAETAVPFAIVNRQTNAVLGSTRFWNIEYWPWPANHPSANRKLPDVCEIGHTWLTRSAIGTAVNTEAKLLMLTHAFETWQVLRVCLHSDERNLRSRAAIERIGARFEGILRAHRMAADFTPRNSARFSIMAAEWPDVKRNLLTKLGQSENVGQ